MRKLAALGTCLLALGLSTASGASNGSVGDGSLVVKEGRGTLGVAVRGGIIGRFDSGRVYIEVPVAGTGSGPIVFGAQTVREITATKTLYIGTDVRFRLIGGFFRVKVQATGMNVSVVGKGYVTLDFSDFIDAGTYSLNGDPFQVMPTVIKTYPLGTP